MKKSEFKALIKPIVTECIRESLTEGGFISGIITEVAKGMAAAPALERSPAPAPTPDPELSRMTRNAFSKDQSSKLQENRTKLMSAIGKESYNGVNLFEGTTPAPAQQTNSQMANPMSGQSPDDAGVDINNLFGAVGSTWTAHMNEMKERK